MQHKHGSDCSRWKSNRRMKAGITAAFLMMLTVVSVRAQTSKQPEGAGTAEDPYRISSHLELYWIALDTSRLHSVYVQTGDINAGSTRNWGAGMGWGEAIGAGSTMFRGSYNGRGHTIDSLFKSSRGLFGAVHADGVIDSVILTNMTLSGADTAAGMLAGQNYGRISNCRVDGSIPFGDSIIGAVAGRNKGVISNCSATADLKSNGAVGGLAGANDNGEINGCTFAGTVTGTSNVGGLVGINSKQDSGEIAIIKSCHADGTVSGDFATGGLVGRNIAGSITDCSVDVSVEGQHATGGLLGMGNSNGQVSGCSAAGTVTGGETHTGGLIGSNTGDTRDCFAETEVSGARFVGGLIGINHMTVTDCRFTGNVSGISQLGGLVGHNNDNGSVQHCYAESDIVIIADTSAADTLKRENTGGLIGMNSGSIRWCYSTGHIAGVDSDLPRNIGGLAGLNDEKGAIAYCCSGANVEGYSYVGGLAGRNRSLIHDCYATGKATAVLIAGGVVGFNEQTGTLGNVYSTGIVDGPDEESGGVYGGWGTLCTGCLWDMTTSGFTGTLRGTGRETAAMKTLSTYLAYDNEMETFWDFDTVWGINGTDNNGYPFLRWQGFDCDRVTPAGAGTVENPYTIATLNDLLWMAAHREHWNKIYRQTADIDAAETATWCNGYGWRPAGDTVTPFSGSYHAAGHRIRNLACQRDSSLNVGLFGLATAIIDSLVLEKCEMSGLQQVGAIVGQNGEIVNYCSVIDGVIHGGKYTGGLAGRNDAGTIGYCSVRGTVSSERYAGGLVGSNAEGEITECFADVSVTGDRWVGGLLGYSSGSVHSCYARGDVNGSGRVGGLIGALKGEITACYATGKVSGDSLTGGFSGFLATASKVTDCFWDIVTSGQETSAGGTGKVSVNLKNRMAFDDTWDFNTVWGINNDDNDGYPFLIWEGYDYTPSGVSQVNNGTECISRFALRIFSSNGSNRIQFDVPEGEGKRPQEVQIAVFDLKGNRVMTPVNKRFIPGRYHVPLSSRSMVPGTYIVQMLAETFTARKKVVAY